MNVLEEIHNSLQLLETRQDDVRNLVNIVIILTGEVKSLENQVKGLQKQVEKLKKS